MELKFLKKEQIEFLQKGQYIGSFAVTTKGIEALQMQNWKQKQYSFENPIVVSTEMISTVPESDYADKISSLTASKGGVPTETSIFLSVCI